MPMSTHMETRGQHWMSSSVSALLFLSFAKINFHWNIITSFPSLPFFPPTPPVLSLPPTHSQIDDHLDYYCYVYVCPCVDVCICVNTYIKPTVPIWCCLCIYDFRTDHSILDNQWGGSYLGDANWWRIYVVDVSGRNGHPWSADLCCVYLSWPSFAGTRNLTVYKDRF